MNASGANGRSQFFQSPGIFGLEQAQNGRSSLPFIKQTGSSQKLDTKVGKGIANLGTDPMTHINKYMTHDTKNRIMT